MTLRRVLLLATIALAVCWWFDAAPAVAQVTAKVADAEITGEYGAMLPPDVSKHGYQIDRLIHLLHWFMGALFVGWGVFFVYCLIRFRQRSGHAASNQILKAKPAKYLEIGVAAFEAVLLLGFSVPIWASVKNDLPADTDNPFHVRVVAEQFAWNFHYPGPDGVFGRTAAEYVNTATNPAGVDPSDPHGDDDITAGELHFPVDRPVLAELSSKDVIHSFFLPTMRVKQDAIPGMRIPVWFEAKATGTYEVACAQLCGNNHYSMRALMVIEKDDAAFEAWLDSQKPEVFDESEFD